MYTVLDLCPRRSFTMADHKCVQGHYKHRVSGPGFTLHPNQTKISWRVFLCPIAKKIKSNIITDKARIMSLQFDVFYCTLIHFPPFPQITSSLMVSIPQSVPFYLDYCPRIGQVGTTADKKSVQRDCSHRVRVRQGSLPVLCKPNISASFVVLLPAHRCP